MNGSDQFTYSAEMGFTHKELLRGLQSAVEPYKISEERDNVYVMTLNDSVARLFLAPEQSRNIASIVLPVTRITIEFEKFSHEQYIKFMDRFKKYLHRGGG